ncbi:hypothetical protein PGB90_007614 [Kerria lacca]
MWTLLLIGLLVRDKKFSSSATVCFSSEQISIRCCFWSALSNLGTNFAAMWCIPNSSLSIC